MKKIKLTFCYLFLAFMTFILLSCNKKEEIKATNINVIGNVNETYCLNDEIDYSYFEIEITFSDNTIKTYTVYDENVKVSGGKTDQIGTFELKFECFDLSKTFIYTVTDSVVHLHFNNGTYNGLSSLDITLTSSTFEIVKYIPTCNESNYQFAGWFYDELLTERVNEVVNGFLIINRSIDLYAGYDYNYDDYFNYTIKDGEVTIDSLNFFNVIGETILTIPSTIKLYPVTKIGDYFSDVDKTGMSSFLTYEKLEFASDSKVKEIGNYAFEHLLFEEISLPESLNSIGEYAFSNILIKSLYIPKNVLRIAKGAFAFNHFTNLEFASDSQLIYIGKEAFYYCQKFTTLILPDKLETIASNAFDSCYSLTNIYISKSVNNIGLHAFQNTPMLKEFIVDEENETYCSIDGNLYSNDKEIFYRYCFAKEDEEFTLPNTVKIIYESAFDLTNEVCHLKKINLSNSLTYIGGEAFKNCNASFILPSSLQNIATSAFWGYSNEEFLLDENNKYFSIIDGMLVSKDKTELFAVPQLYKEELVIPSSIKTIKSGAIYDLKNTKYIYINQDSNLANIDEFGLVPFTMYSLVAIYIKKETPFYISNNAFYYPQSYNYTDFSIIFSNEGIYNNYKNFWKDYINTNSDNETLLIQNFLKNPLSYSDTILHDISFYNFTSYERFLMSFPGFLNEDFEIKKLNIHKILLKIEALYNLNEDSYIEYSDYFNSFIIEVFNKAFDYYCNMDYNELLKVQSDYDKYHLSFSLLPSKIKNTFESIKIDEFNNVKETYDVINQKQEELLNDIMNFTITDEKMDLNKAKDIINRYNQYGSTYITMSISQQNKLYSIECSLLINDFVNTSKTVDNYEVLKGLYDNDDISYKLGIEGYLNAYFVNDESKKNLYQYSKLTSSKNDFDVLESNMYNEIYNAFTSIDINEPYDESKYNYYLSLYEKFGKFSYYLDYEVLDIYNFIYGRKIINDFINIDLTSTDYSNFNDVYNLYTLSYRYSYNDMRLQEVNEYSSFVSQVNDFDEIFSRLTDPYCLALKELTCDKINDTSINNLTSLKNQLKNVASDILFINANGDYENANDVYNAAYTAYLIKDLCNKYMVNNEIDFNASNYVEINKSINGYYVNNTYEKGINEYINENNYSTTFNYYLELFTSNDTINYLQVFKNCLASNF